MADRGRYLYVITRALPSGALTGLVGMDDAPLRVLAHRGLDAVLSEVDLGSFGEEALRRNLEDLSWLERVARRHDDVVQAVAGTGVPVAPMRLATICLSDDGVRERLDQSHEGLTRALERVAGRSEWSVKVFAPPPQEEAADEPRAAGPGGGAAYLQRKKRQAEQRGLAGQRAAETAERVYTALAEASVAGRRLQPQDPRLSGHQGTMSLNAAFLVDDDDGPRFEARLADLSAEVGEDAVQHAGPWPPYSFATLDP